MPGGVSTAVVTDTGDVTDEDASARSRLAGDSEESSLTG